MVVFAAALFATAVHAQGLKVAIVNAQKAVADTQEIKKAQADLTNKYRSRQQSLEALQGDIQNIQTRFALPTSRRRNSRSRRWTASRSKSNCSV